MIEAGPNPRMRAFVAVPAEVCSDAELAVVVAEYGAMLGAHGSGWPGWRRGRGTT